MRACLLVVVTGGSLFGACSQKEAPLAAEADRPAHAATSQETETASGAVSAGPTIEPTIGTRREEDGQLTPTEEIDNDRGVYIGCDLRFAGITKRSTSSGSSSPQRRRRRRA